VSDADDILRKIGSRATSLTVAEVGDVDHGLADVHHAFSMWLHLPDPTPVNIAIATVVAHRLGGDPVWTLLVGTPGSGKTVIIESVAGLAEVHPLSALTAQTFASGLKGKQRASLLQRLDAEQESFLTLKDFTTVLTMHRDPRQEVLSQLREIYDGSYVKEFGTGETVTWQGRIGLLAGVTPIIDTHHAVTSLLGERFVYLRLPATDRRQMSRQALASRGREAQMREELRSIVAAYIDGLDLTAPEMPEPIARRLEAVAGFTTWARSGVERHAYSREIEQVPGWEAPTRFTKQIAAMITALMVMGQNPDAAMSTAVKVAYDCLPPARLEALRLLRATGDQDLPTPELADGIELPTSTARRVAEDLGALGLVTRKPGTGGRGNPDRWRLSDRARSEWQEADPA
jgi:DNA-binding MarR family transcriptional regulator